VLRDHVAKNEGHAMMTRFVRSIRFWGAGVWLLGLVAFPVHATVFTNAYDDASHAAYSGGFTNGANGGFGFGAWDLTNAAGSFTGGFIGDSTQNGRTSINVTGEVAFGLYANPNPAFVDARRTFTAPMTMWQTFRFEMNVSWNGGERGFLLYDGDYTSDRLKISHGGGDALLLNNEVVLANVFNQALTVTVHAVSANELAVTIQGDDTFTTNVVVASLPDRFKFYYSNGSNGEFEGNYEPYFNKLTLSAPVIRYVALGNTNPVSPFTSWATAATNIQAAIDAASAGEIVLVSNGVYQTGGRVASGTLLTNRVVIDKAITVQSVNGPALTSIKGAWHPVTTNGDAAVRCVWITNNATLVGFTLTNGATRGASGNNITEQRGGGAWSKTTGNMRNCLILGNAAYHGGGGAAYGIQDSCTFSGNTARFGGGANDSAVYNSLLSGNLAGEGGGGNAGGVLVNCTIAGNSSLVFAGGSYFGTLNNCIVYSNTAPASANHSNITFNYSCTTPMPAGGSGNITNAPQFVASAFGNYRLLATSPGVNAGTNSFVVGTTDLDGNPRIQNGVVDMGAYEYQPSITGTTHYVALANPNPQWPYVTWATAANSIQDAIDAASPGNTVLVSNGVYQTGGRVVSGSLLTNRVIIDKPITVQSVNGATVTSIKGAWDPVTTNGNAAVRCVWMTNGATLVGFTITNGATRTSGDEGEERSAGGVLMKLGAAVSNCVITANRAQTTGGGTRGGAVFNSLLIGNRSVFGGGSYFSSLRNGIVQNNQATDTGGGAQGQTIENCLIQGNHAATQGGGTYNADLRNCTVVENTAGTSGGGVRGNTAINCIVVNNTANSSNNYFLATLTYTCTTPLPPGTGNLTNAPVFVNAAGGDYRLLSTSPGINAGNNADAPGVPDLDGNPRIAFGTVDMGAYELQSISTNLVVTSLSDGNAGSLRQAIAALPSGGTITFDTSLSGQTLALGSQLVIDKDLAIDGSGLAVAPVLSGGNSNRVLFITNSSDVRLEKLTIADGAVTNTASPNRGGGIYMQGGQLYVYDCTIRNNVATFGGGVSVIDADTSFRNTTIANNAALSAFPDGGALLMDGTAIVHFVHSTIANNQAADEGGGIKVNGGQLILENTVVAGNGPSFAGSDIRFGVDQLIGTNFIGTTSGATLPSGTVLTGNPLLGPLQDNGGPTWTLEPATNSPLLETAGPSAINRDQRGAPRPAGMPDIGAVEILTNTTFYVALDNPTPQWPYITWATAATNIQVAIDEASPGNTVLVSNGVYQAGGRVVSGSLLTNRVVIDKPITVQSVNGSDVTAIKGQGPNGNVAVRCVWMADGATLVGFTLTNGATRTSGDFSTEESGGGVWAQSTNVVVNHCTLTGNSAELGAGGGAYRGTLNHCTLTGNSAYLGGGADSSTLNNCTLTGNSADIGGGAIVSTLNNCTLTGNSAGNGGGADSSTLNNCIVYFNSASTASNYSGGTINNTCTTPMPGSGTGNITNDPMFVSLAATNLQLSVGSPARDMGNNANAPSGPDLAGNPRLVHTFVDMGAYEFQDSPPGDFDGDGMATTDERIAGSDPLNADDTWGVDAVIGPASLSFNTLSNRLYAVDRNDKLLAVPQLWIEFTNNIPGTGGPLVITDPLPGTNRNYRVRVGLAP